MTDWQIEHLLCEKPKEDPPSYDELMSHVWKLRGYTEDEINQIIEWKKEEITDEVLWDRIKEAFGGGES